MEKDYYPHFVSSYFLRVYNSPRATIDLDAVLKGLELDTTKEAIKKVIWPL